MLYAFLIYEVPGIYDSYDDDKKERVMQQHRDLQAEVEAQGKLAVAQLMNTSTAVTVRTDSDAKPITLDGPFAETKELFMGIYLFECQSLEDAVAHAQKLADPCHTVEIRPVNWSGGELAS